MNKYNNEFGQGVASNKVKIQDLIYIIKSEYSSLEQRKEAYKKLIAIDSTFRGTLDSQYKATARLGQAFDSLVVRMQKFAMVQAEMAVKAEKLKAQAEAEMNTGILEVKANEASEKFKKYYERFKKGEISQRELVKLADELGVQEYTLELKKSKEALKEIRKETDYINKVEKQKLDNLQKTIAIQEAQVKGGKIQGRKLNQSEMERLKAELENNKKIRDMRLGVNTDVVVPESTASATPEKVKKSTASATPEKVKNKNTEVEKLYGEDTIKGLQQRISKLNEILETSPVGSAKYNEAKAQKSVYEERLKKLTQTFDDEIKEIERQWKVRYALEEKYGKETAKAQFSGLKGDSFYADIKERFSKVDGKRKSGATLSDEEIAQWKTLKSILDNLNGVKDPFTNYKENLENTLSTIDSSYERIKTLEKELYTMSDADIDSGKKAYLIEKIEAEKKAQRQFYQSFLKEKETFEQKKASIDAKYDSIDAQINGSDKSADEKARLLAESGKARGREYSEAFIEGISNSEMWQKAFGEINEMTTSEIRKSIEYLTKQLKSKEVSGNPEKIKIISDQIKSLQSVLNNNPFEKIKQDYKKMMDVINDPNASLESKLGAIQGLFNSLSVGVQAVGDAFGGFDDATNDAIGNVMAIGNAAFDLGKSIASGDVAGMIKAGVQLIGSIGKALSGDQKKERQIKAWADQVKNLKVQYQELERAIEKALGDDKYKAQQTVIANLEKQKILLQQMIQKEKDKKKTDNGKIDDWQQQISDINAQIDDLKKSIVDDILQIDVKGLADKIGDALIEGFGRGEDALQSLNKTADEVFKDMVKNALKMQLEKNLQPVLSEMLKAMGYTTDSKGNPTGSFDGLTPEERDALKAKIIAATGDYQKAMEQYADLFGSDAANSPNGLKGDIKGITEKTAGALESQINAIRIYQVEALNLHKNNSKIFENQLRIQSQIEINTRPLVQIQKDIAELNSKVKKPLAGL